MASIELHAVAGLSKIQEKRVFRIPIIPSDKNLFEKLSMEKDVHKANAKQP